MAKRKSFKSLPKRAQKAAFAQMDDDGTRKNKGAAKRKSGVSFSAENTKRLNKLRAAKSSARSLVSDKITPLRKQRDSLLRESAEFSAVGGYKEAQRLKKQAQGLQAKINKQTPKLSALNSAARGAKVSTKRGKQAKLF